MLKKVTKVVGVLLVVLVAVVLVINISVRGSNTKESDKSDEVEKQTPKPEVKKPVSKILKSRTKPRSPATIPPPEQPVPESRPNAPTNLTDLTATEAAAAWEVDYLKRNAKLLDFASCSEDGLSLLHQVASRIPETEEEKEKARETIKYLLGQGLSIDCTTADGYTPLMYAISKGNYPVAAMLVDCGASVDSIIAEFEVNPLMLAVRQKNFWLVKMLLERDADILTYNNDGISALQEAVIVGYTEGMRLIIVSLKNAQGNDSCKNTEVPFANSRSRPNSLAGASLLHLAARTNQFEVAQVLVVHYKADRSLLDGHGKTALYYAQQNFKKCDALAVSDPETYFPLLEAAKNIVSLLGDDETKINQRRDDLEAAALKRRTDRARKKAAARQSKLKDEALARYRELGLI